MKKNGYSEVVVYIISLALFSIIGYSLGSTNNISKEKRELMREEVRKAEAEARKRDEITLKMILESISENELLMNKRKNDVLDRINLLKEGVEDQRIRDELNEIYFKVVLIDNFK